MKIQKAAELNKKDPQAFCDEISKTFIDLTKTLNLSNSDFIRTTEERHKTTVIKLWNLLDQKIKFICQSTQVGILSLMKHIIRKMK